MTDTAVIRDALSRIVRIREAIEDGDEQFAYEIAEGLEIDLAAFLDGDQP